jgi:5'-nucleotidase (lipoprotein e(P4) family)
LKIKRTLLVGLFSALLLPFVHAQQGLNRNACGASAQTHENLNAVLWMRTSLEYRHTAMQAYRLASLMLDVALRDNTWTAALEQSAGYESLPPAVILDVDETVLDNSPAQAATLSNATGMFRGDEWDAWVKQASAKVIPGAADFLKLAAAKGVEVFYLTNRARNQEADTIRNLAAEGLPFADEDHVLVKGEVPGWGSDKASRRRYLASRYRILLLVGDDANDFLPGVRAGIAEREHAVAPYASYLGSKWIILPNPTYGSWENALWGGGYAETREQAMKARCAALP